MSVSLRVRKVREPHASLKYIFDLQRFPSCNFRRQQNLATVWSLFGKSCNQFKFIQLRLVATLQPFNDFQGFPTMKIYFQRFPSATTLQRSDLYSFPPFFKKIDCLLDVSVRLPSHSVQVRCNVSVRFISLNDPPTPDPSKSIFLFFSLILFLQILFSQKGSLRSLGSLLLFIEILKYQLILK